MKKERKSASAVAEPAPSGGAGAYRLVEVKAGVFKDTCLQLLDQVRAGKMTLLITKHGEPVAKVVAVDSQLPSAFGFLRGTVVAHDDIVSPDFEAWGDA